MLSLFAAVVLSFLVTFLSVPVVIKIAKIKKLNDIPSERKLHKQPVPTFGGLSIFSAIIFSLTLFFDFKEVVWAQYFLAAIFIILLLGLKDDLIPIDPYKKFAGQILAIVMLISLGNMRIHSFYGFLGINEIEEIASYFFTFIIFLTIINSFNLIDGVDGLASTMGMICSLTLGLLYLKNNDFNGALISLSLSSSLFAFLYYNTSPAKIFLGDTGSLIIGFICSVLAINLFNTQVVKSLDLSNSNVVAVVFASMFIPVFDTARVFFIRVFNKRSPFHPDLNHLHHLLLNKGLNHFQVSSVLGGATVLLVTLALTLRFLGINILVLIFVIIGLLFSHFLRVKK